MRKMARGGNPNADPVFLTAKDEEYHIVRGLDAGGDDYLTNRSAFWNCYPESAR
jgi:DNA-binding response OmpR family regulator